MPQDASLLMQMLSHGPREILSHGLRRRKRRRGRLAVLCALAASALLLSSAPALAATPQLLGSFPAADALVKPQAIGVDQATGQVYVVDVGRNVLSRFDASGAPAEFSASHSYVRANELTGSPTGAFDFDRNAAAEVAVDNSGGPFDGDIYVTDSLHGVIDIYDRAGTYLGQIDGSGTPQSTFSEPCGVAVDPLGRVYVGDFGGYVERYTPNSTTTPLSDSDYQVAELAGTGEACAVAVDAAGDVLSSRWEDGPLSEFSHTQFPATGSAPASATEVDETSHAVAIDPTDETAFVDEGTRLAEYGDLGTAAALLTDFGSLSGNSWGVAVNDSSGQIYASDEGSNSNPSISIYGTASTTAPTVVSESVEEVTADSAKLTAEVNPQFATTTYHFDYGTTAQYGNSAPVPDGGLGDSGGPQGIATATLALANLIPGTTYHYRIVAENTSGPTSGPDQTFTTRPSSAPSTLPDERAWEMVSPPEKNNSIITGIDGFPGPALGGVIQVAPAGSAITYASSGAFSEASSSPQGAPPVSQYLAQRSATGWSADNITPAVRSHSYPSADAGGPYEAFSEDPSQRALLWSGIAPDQNPPLAAGAPAEYQDYYLRETLSGAYQSVLSSPPAEVPSAFGISLEGVTPDLLHVVFSSDAALTAGAVDNGSLANLYEWQNGQLQLVNLLPEQTQGTPGAVLGADDGAEPAGERAISSDGTHVAFTDEGNLYDRIDGAGTIEVDAPPGAPESGGGVFQSASEDGSKVFFTDARRLTAEATPGEGVDLYERDLDTGAIADLTERDRGGAEVQGVLGASADGSYVYFVANGVLASGAHLGHCIPGLAGGGPQQCNLYVWHAGATKFIATLSEEDSSEGLKDRRQTLAAADDWSPRLAERTTRVTPDGQQLVFMSNGRLTGYDNRDSSSGRPDQEVYIYDSGASRLRCASCDPTGARPTGSSSIPAGSQYATLRAVYQSRVLSESGNRVFFDSSDRIAAQDTNSVQDVYEWEAPDTGDCQQSTGCVALISQGTSSDESSFVDASASGDDVFFITRSELVGTDIDQLTDLYDARVHGGLPVAGTPSPPCSEEECRPPPAPALALQAPLSSSFSGLGNLAPPTPVPSKPKAPTKPKHPKQPSKTKKHKSKKQKPQKKKKKKKKAAQKRHQRPVPKRSARTHPGKAKGRH